MIEAINSLEHILSTYGIGGLICFIIIGALIVVSQILVKRASNKSAKIIEQGFNRMSEDMSKQNSQLINVLIDQNKHNIDLMHSIIKQTINDKKTEDDVKHDKDLEYRLNVSATIRHKIHDLLNRYNADRAFILEFHNSKQNLSGLPFLWYDMVYEEIAKGCNLIQSTWKDQEASTLLPVIADINNGDGFKIYSLEELEKLQDTSMCLYHRLRVERQLQEVIMVGLYSLSNKLLGILVLEYEFCQIPVEVLDTEDIISTGASIATLLDCSSSIEQ